MIKTAPQPLSNVQQELLKLFATGISDDALAELKDMISKFLFEKAVQKADVVAREKGYNKDTINSWLNED
jgi:hypothetical protein